MSFLSMKMPLGRPNWVKIFEQLPVLVEFLDAVVPAVADIEMACLVHRQAMRHFELTATDAMLAPLLDELAFGCRTSSPGHCDRGRRHGRRDEDGAVGVIITALGSLKVVESLP